MLCGQGTDPGHHLLLPSHAPAHLSCHHTVLGLCCTRSPSLPAAQTASRRDVGLPGRSLISHLPWVVGMKQLCRAVRPAPITPMAEQRGPLARASNRGLCRRQGTSRRCGNKISWTCTSSFSFSKLRHFNR